MEMPTASDVFLAAFSREIASFLSGNDLRCLPCVSRLLYVAYTHRSLIKERERRAQQLVQFVHRQPLIAKEFKQLLHGPPTGKQGKNKGAARTSDAQLQPLVRDLVLVGLGVRASCLVDTCQLKDAAIQRMLEAFNEAASWREYGLHRLRTIRLAGNVFFANLNEFVRLKSRDLVTKLRRVGLIDASVPLESPRAIGFSKDTDLHVRDELLRSVHDVVDKLLASVRHPREIIHLKTANATALAGLLLCYPVIYHVNSGESNTANDEDALWTTSENCLSMCPLYLLQASITIADENQHHQLPLQEFSVPQHVVDNSIEFPRLQSISSVCRRSLVEAIGESDTVQVHVDITPRTLSHVAL